MQATAACDGSGACPVADHKARGTAAFKKRDYLAAVHHYSAALEGLSSAGASMGSSGGGEEGEQACLRLALLTNRSLAHHRLGAYQAAAEDAEAALGVDGSSAKAAFRAAVARLMLGNAAAAQRHCQLLGQPAGEGALPEPAGWAAVRQHAAALLAHQQRVEAHRQQQAQQEGSRVDSLLQALADEAEGEDSGTEGGAAALLQQLAGVMGGDSSSSGKGSSMGSIGAADLDGSAAAAAAAAALDAAPGQRGWRLLLFFLADPDPQCCAAAVAALQAAGRAAAAGSAAVLWPAEVWHRLSAAATSLPARGQPSMLMVAAMQLLCWAAGRDAWVRQQLLPSVLPLLEGCGGAQPPHSQSPLAQIVGLLGDSSQLHRMPPAAVVSAAQLLQVYGSDPASAEALQHNSCSPLLVLLRAAGAAEGMAAFQEEDTGATGGGAGGAGSLDGPDGAPAGLPAGRSGTAGVSMPDAELEALQALRAKRRAVYNAELVAVRRGLLAAAAQLAGASRELLLAEAVVPAAAGTKKGGGSSSKRAAVTAGPFLTELLGLVRELHEQQPRRTTPVLGPDGTPKAYAKRRFAADYKDNPTGDYLLSLDLQDAGGSGCDPCGIIATQCSTASGPLSEPGKQQGQPTLLELALRTLQHAVVSSASVAALLYRRDLFALCDELAGYCTHAVVAAAQQLFASVADLVPAAGEELIQSGTPTSLAGLLLYSASPQRQEAALGKLAAAADTCSGDDFALLTGMAVGGASGGAVPSAGQHPSAAGAAAAAADEAAKGSAVYHAWQLAAGKVPAEPAGPAEPAMPGTASSRLPQAAYRFLLRCCERAQRQQQLGPSVPPRGGAWAAIGRQAVLQLLARERQLMAAAGRQGAPPAQQEGPAFSSFKRGFFSKPAASPGRVPAQAAGASHAPGLSGSQVHASISSAPGSMDGGLSSTSGASQAGKLGPASIHKGGAVVIEELEEAEPSGVQMAAAPLLPRSRQAHTMHGELVAAAGQGARAALPAGQAAASGLDANKPMEAARGVAPSQQGAAVNGGHGQAVGQMEAVEGGVGVEEVDVEDEDDVGDEEEVEDLQDVYDSASCITRDQRQARAAWMALPMEKKLRWNQTSSDVSVTLTLPSKTRVADVQVAAGGGRLEISLQWYGRVVEGPLHRSIKAGDTHWCLEGDELHLLLAKADDSWWKSLLEGAAEKSYFDILKEAVDADEPVQPYDQLDDSAKGLIEAIQERQAYINAGLIDPEGFDDFRVVIGENSLTNRVPR